MEIQIKLKTFDEIKEFVRACTKFPGSVDVCSERYVINGKSLMGMLSLDYNKAVYVKIRKELAAEEDVENLLKEISSIVKNV